MQCSSGFWAGGSCPHCPPPSGYATEPLQGVAGEPNVEAVASDVDWISVRSCPRLLWQIVEECGCDSRRSGRLRRRRTHVSSTQPGPPHTTSTTRRDDGLTPGLTSLTVTGKLTNGDISASTCTALAGHTASSLILIWRRSCINCA